MQSLRPDLKREGIVVANNRELAELAGPRWAVSSTLYFLYNIRFVYVCMYVSHVSCGIEIMEKKDNLIRFICVFTNRKRKKQQ
jgi:hypothetical protein